ncbi:MAG: acyl-CoA dehydrogenase family protein [Solirubrobacterales bacterium]
MISMDLTREQKKLVDLVRELAQEEIAPKALALDKKGDQAFDWSLVNLLARHNLLCPTIPKEYGGLGLGHLTTALIIEELGAGCAGVAAVVAANLHAASPIMLAGTAAQKAAYLPLLTTPSPKLLAFALTEPQAGSDLLSIQTQAIPKGADYLISGTKEYILNASVASFFSVFTAAGPQREQASIRAFIVPADSPGLTVGPVLSKVGLRYANTARVTFHRVRVTPDQVIGGDRAGSGYLLLTQTFDRGRALVGAAGVGIARSAYEMALEHARNRQTFGKKIIQHQSVAFALAEIATNIEMARLMTWKACWLIDRDQDYTTASSMAKLAATRVARDSADLAADLVAAGGYMAGHPVDKLVRDARGMATIEGTDNIQKLIIASLL